MCEGEGETAAAGGSATATASGAAAAEGVDWVSEGRPTDSLAPRVLEWRTREVLSVLGPSSPSFCRGQSLPTIVTGVHTCAHKQTRTHTHTHTHIYIHIHIHIHTHYC
eukprot:GHVU01140494.1.p2 GENE.GHVU01140494.1~~GHVU01140494.1.p2  ORF type:complete len:108 (-),score=9.65 GHVU01140494.1:19-342(-)